MWGGDATPPEENADLPGFHPERVHLLLQGVYGDFPHCSDRSHLDWGIVTTLHGNVDGAGSLLSQRAGTPLPPELRGAASRLYFPWNGGGFLHGVGTPRDPSPLPTLFSQRRWAS